MLHPGNLGSVVHFLHSEMEYADVRWAPVPVLLARRDLPNRPTPGLNPPYSGEDMQGLAEGGHMPGNAGAWLKGDAGGANLGGSRRINDRIVPNRSGKGIRGSAPGYDRTGNSNIYGGFPQWCFTVSRGDLTTRPRAGMCSALGLRG